MYSHFSAYNCPTAPYVKSDGQVYCALSLRGKFKYRDAIEVCTNQGARLPVIRTFDEQAKVNERRKQVYHIVLSSNACGSKRDVLDLATVVLKNIF